MARREFELPIPETGPIPVGHKVRALRWERNMPISQLAAGIGGYTKSHLSHVETGSDKLTDNLLKKVLNVFGLTREEFDDLSREQLMACLANGSPTPESKPRKQSISNKTLGRAVEVEELSKIRDELALLVQENRELINTARKLLEDGSRKDIRVF